MRSFIFLLLLTIAVNSRGQSGTYYVAAKGGLSLRDRPDVNATVITKIPYATKVSVSEGGDSEKPVNTEGLNGFWKKVTYNSKSGYIVDSYLIPWPPPAASIRSLKDYIRQVTVPFGAALEVKGGEMNNIEDGGWQMNKHLYRNGAEWHEFTGYEYGSNTWFLPGFDIQQAFVLLRLLPEFHEIFTEKDVFPLTNKTYKKGQVEYDLKVEMEDPGTGLSKWVKKIKVEWGDGAVYTFEMYMVENQVVIFLGSGV
jgi:hypothetical protein